MANAPAPSDCVCTALRMASRAITRHYDHALAPARVSANEFAILSRLDDEGPLPLGALAARLAMDRSTLSRDLGPLLRAQLVDAAPGSADRRKRILSLTSLGEACVAEARPLWARAQASLGASFGTDRAAELVRELHALVGAE